MQVTPKNIFKNFSSNDRLQLSLQISRLSFSKTSKISWMPLFQCFTVPCSPHITVKMSSSLPLKNTQKAIIYFEWKWKFGTFFKCNFHFTDLLFRTRNTKYTRMFSPWKWKYIYIYQETLLLLYYLVTMHIKTENFALKKCVQITEATSSMLS